MKACPNCGYENSDANIFCVQCGKPLEKKIEPLRNNISENLRFAFNLAGSNLKIFYPTIAVICGYILVSIALILVFGISLFGFAGSDTPAIPASLIFIVVVVVMIAFMYLGLILTPFFQHVYKTAVIGEEISLRVSFKYARGMFLPYLGAFLAMMLLLGVAGGALWYVFPPDFDVISDDLTSPDDIDYPDLLTILKVMPWFLLMIPLIAFNYLALYLMAWDKVSIIPALKTAFLFVRMRFKGLLILSILNLISGIGLSLVPFGVILAWALSVVFNLALIDHYLNFQRTITNYEGGSTIETPKTPPL